MSKGLTTLQAHKGVAATAIYTKDSGLLTAGVDGSIKLHEPKVAGSAPKIIGQLDLQINSVAISKDKMAVGGQDAKVTLYDFPSGKMLKTLVHFTLPIRHVAFSPDGQWVAVASDEPTIRVVSTTDISDLKVLKGHSKSVRCVAFDPKGDYLVSTSNDGSVRIWDMRDTSESSCVKELKAVLPSCDVDSPDRLSIAWSPDGTKFAIPGRKDVMVIENETWDTLFNLSGTHSGAVDVIAWNPNGNNVATIDKDGDGQIVVWDVRTKQPVNKQVAKKRILAFSWEGSGQMASFVDVNGTLSTWKGVLSSSSSSKDTIAPKVKTESAPATKSFFDDEVKESTKPKDKAKAIRGLDDSDDESDDDGSKVGVHSDEDGIGDGFVVDDDGAGYADYGIDIPQKERQGRSAGFNRSRYPDISDYGSASMQLSFQKPFQPGSTPMRPGKTTRYLAFNLTGLVYTIDQSTHSTVHVEFHDRSAQRPFSFTDHYNYSMATLGDRGALFACESALGSPSRVFYHPFESWATKSEWQAELGANENIKAIALSTRGAHIATDQNYLRSFSYSGVQTHVMSLPGPVVSMCAGPDDSLVVVYTAGAGVAKTHNLGYLLFDVTEMTCGRRDGLPISPSSDLQWLGYSEIGNLATFDSLGVLRILMPHSDFVWVPMLETRLSKGERVESYWPVGLTETDFMCVIVKGAGDPYPTYPNRLISQLSLQAPLLHLGTNSGALEEEFFRRKLLTNHAKGNAAVQGTLDEKESELLMAEKEMDKLLLKLILAAIKAEKLQRALDLTTQLNIPRSIDGAVKLAINDHFPGLAERMNLIKEAKLIKAQAGEERNQSFRMDDSWARRPAGGYREPEPVSRQRSPLQPPPRQREDPLESAFFANNDHDDGRYDRSPPSKPRKSDEPRNTSRAADKPKKTEEKSKSRAEESSKKGERAAGKFNPFAVSSDAKPSEQGASGATNLLNAMDESEKQKADKEDATVRKRKQAKNADTDKDKGIENAPPKKVRTLTDMFGFKRKEEPEQARKEEQEEVAATGGHSEETADVSMDD